MKRFSVTTLAAFGMLVGTIPVALAQTCSSTGPSGNCNCVGTITGPATINGNIVVSGFCNLMSVTVTGNVTVGTGARLIVNGGKVGGNVQADGCKEVVLNNLFGGSLSVGGNVQIHACTGFGKEKAGEIINLGTSSLIDIGGNVQVDDNPGGADVEGNTVGGNVEVNGNVTFTTVTDNTIGGNLTCTGNNPPVDASGNTVHGTTNCP